MPDLRPYSERREPAVTDMQERFALGLAGGLSPTEAARVAGYSAPAVVASKLRDHPGVRAVVRRHRERRIDKLASLSLRVLEELVRGAKSEAVRFNAVKLSLGLAGHVEPKAGEEDEANPLNRKRFSEMSVDELDAFIAREKGKRADAAKPIIDQPSGQSQANPLKDNEKTEPLTGCALVIDGLPPSPGDDGPARPEAGDPDPTPGGYPP